MVESLFDSAVGQDELSTADQTIYADEEDSPRTRL
jgi:hypothetical protein